MTTHTIEVQLASKNPEKIHSRVFQAAVTATDPIIKSVYISRPMANGHTKAKITVEFLD